MSPVEVLLYGVIWASLLIPVWLLGLFVVGWFFDSRRREEAFYWLDKRKAETRRRIDEAGL